MKSNGLLWTATLIMMLWLAIAADAYFLPDKEGDAVKRAVDMARSKRYTDFQERASAFCTGMCMYEERKPYSSCFDACNW